MSVTPPAAPPAPPAPPPRLARRVARWMLGLLLAAWCLLLAAWLLLHGAILPHIDEWRPLVERRASAALGVKVGIGAIDVRSGGWVPAFELRDVVLHDAAQREALRLPRVFAALSPRSLLTLRPRLRQLLIDAPELELRVDALGRLHVAGIAMASGGADDGAAADWFFEQREFVVRNGRVRWVDERRVAPPLELADVQFVLRNGLRRHDLRLAATPPPDWGERFTVTGRFTQALLARAGDWRRWSGTLHAELPRADFAQLRRHAELPFASSEGHGALRGWLDVVDGAATAATLDFALADVALRLKPELDALAFERLEGRLVASRRDGPLQLAAERLQFRSADGIDWPAGALALTLQPHDGGGEFTADRLDLAALSAIASRLPLGEPLHAALAELQPAGVVSGLQASWSGALEAPTRYRASAQVAGLALASRPAAEPGHLGRPGLSGADVQWRADERGGEATLALADGTLNFPGLFERPEVTLQRFDAKLAWRIEPRADAPPRWQVQVGEARFANVDAAGTLTGSWRTGDGEGLARGGRFPGVLDLDAKLERGLAGSVARYLPLGIPRPARRYVERAVKGGQVTRAAFKVRGDLWDLPFIDTPQGIFRVAASLRDVAFDYLPSVPAGADEPAFASPWPGATKVDGELVFERGALLLRNASARLGGVDFGKLDVRIADLHKAPVVEVDASGRGALADGLAFVERSPVGGWIGGALAQASAAGPADLKLRVSLPIGDIDAGRVQGSVALGGNDLRIRPDVPLLGNARGRVDFTQQGFAIVGGTARVAGGDASIDGGSRPDGSVRIAAKGSASAEGLRALNELPLLAHVAGSLTGRAAYSLALGLLPGRGSEIEVTSDLVGMASTLPAPLAKRADAALPLRYRTALVGEARDRLELTLGQNLQAQFTRDVSGDRAKVLAGGIGVGTAAPAPSSGVHASIDMPGSLDVDVWQAALAGLTGATGVAGATGAPNADDAGGGYEPTHIALRAGELVADGRRLTRLVVGASLVDDAWRANLDADQLAGHVEWRPSRSGRGAGRVYARLARLALPPLEAQSFDTLLVEAEPARVPALDIVVDDFELRGKKLGRLEIEALNRRVPSGTAEPPREWRLSKLVLANQHARFWASGQWLQPGEGAARRRTVLDFRLDLADSGALLERLGFGKVLRNGKGRLQGQVSWNGSPLQFDPGSLSGQLEVAIDSGQFLKVEPGVARLLGVLSLQALPRRLALDFRDVFQQGFAFDDIAGDIRVESGVAHTNNLRMRGVQAAVLMEGSADLGRETQALRVVVVPEINAATASLAYAVINPAIGLGTFLAQMFLRRPLAQAATREFEITGPWADPKVERVERKVGDNAPAEPRTP